MRVIVMLNAQDVEQVILKKSVTHVGLGELERRNPCFYLGVLMLMGSIPTRYRAC